MGCSFNRLRELVVAIEHGERRRRRAGAFEQLLLGREVGFHRAVKIQVIAREIGEDGGVEAQAVHAPQLQRVRGDLHGGVGAAKLLEFGEEPHEIERFRRGVDGRQYAIRQMIFDGSDQRRSVTRGAQNGIDQEAGGGLAVGSGDAGEAEAFVRLAVEVARGEGERLASVLDLNPSIGVEISFARRFRFASDGDGAAFHGARRERASIGAGSGKCEEQEAGLDAARIVIEPAHLFGRERGRERLLQPYARE